MFTRSSKLAILSCLACCCLGCTTGPTATQNRAGLESTNSPLNKVTQIDDQGTISSEVASTTDWIHSTPGDTVSHTTGQVTRTVLFKDGTGKELSLRSGSDISATGVKLDPATGTLEIGTFSTSASAPLTALGDLQAKYQDTFTHLSDNQRLAVQSAMDSIKTVAPDLFSLIAKALGVP